MTTLSHLSFDRTMLLFKKEGVDEYGIFSFWMEASRPSPRKRNFGLPPKVEGSAARSV